jgi:hypothetical protein
MKSIQSPRASAVIAVVMWLLALTTFAHAQSLNGNATWSVQTANRDTSSVYLEVRIDSPGDHSSWGSDVPFATLAGLSRGELDSPGTTVRFDVVRDAGTLHCVGYASRGAAGGTFTYAPSSAYVGALGERGIAPPTDQEQLRMTLSNVTIAFVDVLRENGDKIEQPQELLRLVDHGVSERYVSALAALGYRGFDTEELVRLVDHGVTASFVAGMQGLGYHPTSDELVRLVDHGITIDYVKHLRDHGYRPTIDQLVRLRDAGVS